MQIEPNDLLLFARIADGGSFSRAAEQLGLPKSTISRRISQLEARLGERLLQRTTRKLVLTEFGQQLLDHGRQVAAEVEAAVSLAQHRQVQPSGVLRISMPNDFANLMLATLLSEFSERYPSISLELDLSARRVDLLGESFDLAIRVGELRDDATLTAKRIYTVRSGIYASPAYLEKHGAPLEPDELMRHHALHLLSANREATVWILHRDQEKWQGAPAGRVLANSPELLVRLACQGVGIVAAPDDFAHPFVQVGELVRVLPAWCLPPVNVWAVFPGRRLLPAKTRVFMELLEQRLERR